MPAIEITVRFPGSCPVLVAGGTMVYCRPELLKESSGRICAHALNGLVPAADSLAAAAAAGTATEIAEVACTSSGCGAIFSMRALSAQETERLSAASGEPAGRSRAIPQRETRRLSTLDDPAETPLLSRLEPELVQEIVDLSLVSQYDRPTVVIESGQEGQALYVVGNGELEVVREMDDGHELVIATLGKGECFGEISLLTGQPANATVRTKGANAAVLVLPKERLDALLATRQSLRREVSRIVAYRLYRTNAALDAKVHRGLNGSLSMIGVIDLVQTLHASRRTGTLELSSVDRTSSARVGVSSGEVVGAMLDDRAGPDAFFEIITWADGSFSFVGGEPSLPSAPGAGVSGGTMALLMEGLRRIDEKGRME